MSTSMLVAYGSNVDLEVESAEYSFYRDDTYLHIFGNQNGTNLMKILYHRVTVSILLLYGLYCTIITFAFTSFRSLPSFYITWCVFGLCAWIWITFGILSVNRIAFRLIITKFDFWAKVVFSFIFVISFIVWSVCTSTFDTKNDPNSITMYVLKAVLIGIDFILLITYYSLSDGMQILFQSKLYLGLSLTVANTVFFVQYIFFINNNKYHLESVIYPNYLSISWHLMVSLSSQTLNLFLWKNVYILIKYRNKSIIMNTVPKIDWIKHDHDRYKFTNSLSQLQNIYKLNNINNLICDDEQGQQTEKGADGADGIDGVGGDRRTSRSSRRRESRIRGHNDTVIIAEDAADLNLQNTNPLAMGLKIQTKMSQTASGTTDIDIMSSEVNSTPTPSPATTPSNSNNRHLNPTFPDIKSPSNNSTCL